MRFAGISSDRSYKLDVLVPIVLLRDPPQDNPQANVEVGQLHPGEPVEVLGMGYGKIFVLGESKELRIKRVGLLSTETISESSKNQSNHRLEKNLRPARLARWSRPLTLTLGW